jgi:predicted RecA/RadA family phage recombinase
MANYARFVQGDSTVDYTPTADVAAGQVVVQGDLIGVAKKPIPANTLGALATEGILDFPKVTSGGSGMAAGTTVYWDATNSVATATSTGNKPLGKTTLVCADADTTVRVAFYPWGTVSYNPLTNGIPDPGASGAIPVNASGHVELVTAGAETRTLGAPTFIGQELLLSFQTKVGNCVVTCATTVNTTGNNTITFSAAGQAMLLVGKANGANIRWSVDLADGAALSTV